jgi:hypothetical protein
MAFVLVDTVKISDLDQARAGLHGGLIPFIKSMAGFVQGTWAADVDAGEGLGMMVFDTRENAQAALDAMGAGTLPPGVTPTSARIYEVQGQA